MSANSANIATRAGFTLVETLAALAIAAAIILSVATLLHQSVFFFDYGTRTVDRSEQLALAVDGLTRDFSAARFIVPKDSNKVAFIGSGTNQDEPAKVAFITSGGKASGPQGEEVVTLTVEQGDGFTQLVRRRTAWTGPRMGLEDARPDDSVIFLKGHFDISFSFSELTDGQLVWHDDWTGEKGLPHSVRLNVHDPETGVDLLPGSEFPIYADASPACSSGRADCLTLAAANPNQPGNPGAAQNGQAK